MMRGWLSGVFGGGRICEVVKAGEVLGMCGLAFE